MKNYKSEQRIGQLEKRKGGYFYIKIESNIVNQFENKKQTRLLCTIDNSLTFQCGLNHLGDGNDFIILSTKNLKEIGKSLGDLITFEISEDPNPLGVDMPEVLLALLEQDEDLKITFDNLTLGKKRTIIHSINKIKDIYLQLQKTTQLINESYKPRQKNKRLN